MNVSGLITQAVVISDCGVSSQGSPLQSQSICIFLIEVSYALGAFCTRARLFTASPGGVSLLASFPDIFEITISLTSTGCDVSF